MNRYATLTKIKFYFLDIPRVQISCVTIVEILLSFVSVLFVEKTRIVCEVADRVLNATAGAFTRR